jgi:hypothetical protein
VTSTQQDRSTQQPWPSARGRAAAQPSTLVVWLAAAAGALGGCVAAAGLLWQGGAGPFAYTSVRGQTVELYGRGLYEFDTLFTGAANKGTDAVTLLVAIPVLVVAIVLYRRASHRGGLLLLGALPWFLYVGASYALGAVAYNELFLVYVALLSASLFAFVLTFRTMEAATPSWFSDRLPRRGPAAFMVASGLVTLGVWLMEPLGTLVTGSLPKYLGTYSTLFTHALDMAVIVPAALVAGVLILRRRPLGYLVAMSLLVLEAMLAPMMIAQTLSQVRAGISFTAGEVVGVLAGFGVLAVIAVWVAVAILRSVAAAASAPIRPTS